MALFEILLILFAFSFPIVLYIIIVKILKKTMKVNDTKKDINTIYDEKFENLYSKILKENEHELEEIREKANVELKKRGQVIARVLVVALICFGILDLALKIETPGLMGIAIAFMFVGVLYLVKKIPTDINNNNSVKFIDIYKEKVIKSLLNSFEENINYIPNKGISVGLYNQGDFDRYERYHSEDLMEGKLKCNCDFSMSEVSTEYTTTDEDGHIHYHNLFSGLVAVIETPKTFPESIYLRKDIKDKNILTRPTDRMVKLSVKRVELDSPEFEKHFDVYASNNIIVMQLLTADIMQMLTEFEETMNMKYEITIKNSKIYIRFHCGYMFEPDFGKNSLDKELLYKYYKMLDFTFTLTYKIIDLLNETNY